jgi:aspartyl-tRNA synthetase
MYGTDKPDLRNPLIIEDISDIMDKTSFEPFKNTTVRCIKVDSIDKSNSWYKSMEEYVDNVEFIAAGASTTHSCCVASFNNVTKISVTRIFQELDIEREFFKFLSQLGLEVIVSSNLWEEN